MKLLKYLLVGLLALFGFMVVRTVVVLPAGEAVTIKDISLDEAEVSRVAANLSKAITFKTISHSTERAPDPVAFNGFHAFLRTAYPLVHETMELETISDYSLMYRWPGSGSDKRPIALTAHFDVVPVSAHGVDDWRHPPFAGFIDDNGVLWGRGALDDKSMLISLMEAAETMIASGFEPTRDIYFLFGHDEEIGGDKGAALMAARLKDKGVQLAWAMDEGSGMAEGVVPGVKSPVALISLGEKGSVTLRFSAEGEGGHSSAPKPYTAASLAAKAGVAVMDNPHPQILDEHLESFLRAIAPEMGFANRMAIANMWATRSALTGQLAKSPITAAFMHTTTAMTMMHSGTKSNVLPQYGEATVNYRIHPRDTVESVKNRAQEIIGDERVTIAQLEGREATRMSSVDSEGYQMIAKSIHEVFGDIPTAPTLTVQGTDARHYYSVADDVYRFMPFVFQPDDIKRIHGTNEAIDIRDLAKQVVYFRALIMNAAN